jgi:hypothetical protein
MALGNPETDIVGTTINGRPVPSALLGAKYSRECNNLALQI